ncbi:MAG TPA: PAS domain S-box protein [Spirochaetota bacterium]|nr:PAS domain S-box protein [Spirochaetota bacterium]HPC41125.1 PAS domain S-box protein [Spirochaetota bacterium]HPL15546.1 PAS domain S-box protein [Spirochaetota bacterium]HQF07045.1 PAS domain S-box protein [Spirochaetota bacterium]HQH95782.1 PAS domain S-box protein [Spirochaetota bacterium]
MLERFKRPADSPLDLTALRIRLIDILALIYVIALPVSYAVSFPFFFSERYFLLSALDIVLWIALLIRVMVPSIGYRISSIIWLAMLYMLTISFVIYLGPNYARVAWMILCVAMASIFFGTRAAIASTAFNALMLITLYRFMPDSSAAWNAVRQMSFGSWTMFIVNSGFISLSIGIPVGYLIINLNRSLQNERQAKEEQSATLEELEAAMEELQATNEEFEAQNEELVRSEQELSAKETFIRRIVENAPAVIFRLNLTTGLMEFASPGSVNLTGYTLEETATGRNLFKKLVPDEWKDTLKSYWKNLEKGNSVDAIRYPIIHKSGELRWIEQRNVILRDEGGRTVGVEGFCTDITMQVEMEEALRQSEEQYRNLVENINEVIFSVDAAGYFTYITHAITRVAEFTPAELLGKNFLSFIHPEDIPVITRRFVELSENIRMPLEYRIVTRSGQTRWVMSYSNAIIVNGEFQGINGIITDIHDRKEAEAERERVQNQLVQAQKMEAVGTLAGGLAHDFNNMLGGIMGSLDLVSILLKKEELSQGEAIRNYLDTALDSTRRAADLTRRLLTLSRKKELNLAPVDVNRALTNVLKICRGSFPKSVRLDFRIGEKEMLIHADATQVEQVLINLCLNASQAMTTMRPEGDKAGGTLRVLAGPFQCGSEFCAVHPEAEPGAGYVRIQVCDTGVGMDPDTKKRIFEPFFTTKQKDSGTGLGLAMAYGIIKQHQGFIDVYSEPGKGSTFTIYIPRLSEAAGVTAAEKRNGIVQGRGLILVVDDEEAILRVAKGMLGQFGYEVLTAKNAAEGIDLYRAENGRISAVILDLSMPGMSGLEAYDRMKEINPGIRALLTSGLMEDDHMARSREKGIRGFVQKPYSAEELSRKIKEIIG